MSTRKHTKLNQKEKFYISKRLIIGGLENQMGIDYGARYSVQSPS